MVSASAGERSSRSGSLSAGGDNDVCVWDSAGGRLVERIGTPSRAGAVRWLGNNLAGLDGTDLVAAACRDDHLRIFAVSVV